MRHIQYLGAVSVPEDSRCRVAGDLASERHLAIDSDSLVTRRHHERRRRYSNNTTTATPAAVKNVWRRGALVKMSDLTAQRSRERADVTVRKLFTHMRLC